MEGGKVGGGGIIRKVISGFFCIFYINYWIVDKWFNININKGF